MLNGRQTFSFARGSVATAAVACLVVFCVFPAIALFAKASVLDGESALRSPGFILAEARQWKLLWNSFAVAFGTAVGVTLLGAPLGYAIGYAQVPSRKVLPWLLGLPILMPPYVLATAWIDVLGGDGLAVRALRTVLGPEFSWSGPYTIPGVILVQSLAYYPLVSYATLLALRRFDGRFEDAARLSGQRRRAFFDIVVPLTLPAVWTGALAAFGVSLLSFSVPSLLQVNTYPVEIYASSVTYEYAEAGAQSLPLLALCLAALAVWGLYLRPRYAWLTGAQRLQRAAMAGPRKVALDALCWLVIALSVGVPLVALFVRSLPLRTYAEVWRTAQEELITSLWIASISATALVTLSFACAVGARRRSAFALVQGVSLLPFTLSGPLLGLGLIALWNRPGYPGLVYDTPAILVMACLARYLVFANVAMAAGLNRLQPRLEEAAEMSGVTWWRTVTGIVLPLQAPYMLACWGLMFIFCMGEVDATVLVSPPGTATLAVRLFTLMHYGPDAYVAALSMLTMAVMIGVGATAAVGYTWLRGANAVRH